MNSLWWQTAIFYQIYPRSFQDTNNDGIGDISGIIQRLDYLKTLGITGLWISPFFKSPMKDFGYDISDYYAVDPLFGTLENIKELLFESHKRGIHVIFDLVINHTSDQHPWFQEARNSRDSLKHDWYLWANQKDPKTGKRNQRPNNWICQFEFKSAWHNNKITDEWFLGTFTSYQPEVNWRNAQLRQEMYKIIRFWLDLGVDGFRMDVVNWYIKDDKLRNNPFSWVANPDIFQKHIYDRNRPEIHEICREIRQISDTYSGDRLLVGEIFHRSPIVAASYQNPGELHLAFNMDLIYQKWNAHAFFCSLDHWYSALPPNAWPNITLSNHDQPRHAQRFFSKNNTIQQNRCRIAAMLLLTVWGTPFIYYGEEIGMTGVHISRKEMIDPTGLTFWPLPLGRDPERTPMQWTSMDNSGFSKKGVRPWLPIQNDFRVNNVERQQKDENSLWHWYKKLISIRSSSKVLQTGGFIFLSDCKDGLVSYIRTTSAHFSGYKYNEKKETPYCMQQEDILICLNFINNGRNIYLNRKGLVGLGNYRSSGEELKEGIIPLAPYEALLVFL